MLWAQVQVLLGEQYITCTVGWDEYDLFEYAPSEKYSLGTIKMEKKKTQISIDCSKVTNKMAT